jgi:hypothetical protein
MRKVISTDDKGFDRVYQIRDKDNDRDAKYGIPIGPPDISQLDWDRIIKELNNELVSRGLITWDDVMKSQNGLSQVIISVIRRNIVELYKQKEGVA